MPDLVRKAHVWRVYGKDANGDDDQDVWIDVMRIDKLPILMGGMKSGKTGQIVRYEMDWGDDTPESTPLRKYKKLTVNQPDGDASVELPIIVSAKLLFGGMDDGTTGQLVKFVFDTGPDNEKRKSTLVRVLNNDLNNEVDMTVGAAVSWDDYQQALAHGKTDDSQYVDAEVTDKFTLETPQEMVGAADGTRGQLTNYELLNKDIESLFGRPSGSDIVPVFTDPLQTIVNVSWTVEGLAVEFGDTDQGPPE